jgi:hypothetical protein
MIEFQYFEGCPNADETLKNLIALKDEGIYKRKNKNFEREKSCLKGKDY